MHGLPEDMPQAEALADLYPAPDCDILICPPLTLLGPLRERLRTSAIALGAQDCHAEPRGAHTGDVAAPMIRAAGASYVILGHSERRTDHGESDAVVRAKVAAAWEAGLTAILCLGETLEDREAGRTLDVIGKQLDGSLPDGGTGENLVLAYEPIWAIGTGHVPSGDQIAEVHAFLREGLAKRIGEESAAVRLLYGGSVKPDNAAEIFALADVDGALVGGASLKAQDFGAIISALEDAIR